MLSDLLAVARALLLDVWNRRFIFARNLRTK